MKTTAGVIRKAARNPRLSVACRQRLRGVVEATASIRFRTTQPGKPHTEGMAEIQLEQLTKVYADGTRAVSDLDLEIGDGELVVFVGPSGCGKTSALRMIAGLEEISGGVVRVGGRVVND